MRLTYVRSYKLKQVVEIASLWVCDAHMHVLLILDYHTVSTICTMYYVVLFTIRLIVYIIYVCRDAVIIMNI